MAKQSYGADTGLIKGAQALYASEIPQYDFSSIGKIAGEFADVFTKLSEKKEKEVQKRKELEFKAAELASTIDEADVSGIKLADSQKEKVQGYFESQDSRIEDIVGELKTLDEFDPKRIELKKELEKIKQARLNVVANVAKLEKGLNENILDIEQGNYSPANNMNKVNIMVGIKNGEYGFDIDENGNLSFPINQAYTEQTEDGIEETKTRIDKYTLEDLAGEKSLVKPADKLRTSLTEQMKKAGDAGRSGKFDDATKQDIFATMQQLTADLTAEETLDLAVGKFGAIGGPFANMPIEDLKELQSKNPVQFKNEVINSFYRTALDFGETGQRAYDAKNTTSKPDENKFGLDTFHQTFLDNLEIILNDAITNTTTGSLITPQTMKLREGVNKYKLEIINGKIVATATDDITSITYDAVKDFVKEYTELNSKKL